MPMINSVILRTTKMKTVKNLSLKQSVFYRYARKAAWRNLRNVSWRGLEGILIRKNYLKWSRREPCEQNEDFSIIGPRRLSVGCSSLQNKRKKNKKQPKKTWDNPRDMILWRNGGKHSKRRISGTNTWAPLKLATWNQKQTTIVTGP